jgi:hypothetical protein
MTIDALDTSAYGSKLRSLNLMLDLKTFFTDNAFFKHSNGQFDEVGVGNVYQRTRHW